MFTASAVTQIYDKVNDANKKKMEKLALDFKLRKSYLAFKLMQKSQKENAAEKKAHQVTQQIQKRHFLSERVKDGKVDPLSKMGKSPITGREVSQYYKANPKQRWSTTRPYG